MNQLGHGIQRSFGFCRYTKQAIDVKNNIEFLLKDTYRVVQRARSWKVCAQGQGRESRLPVFFK